MSEIATERNSKQEQNIKTNTKQTRKGNKLPFYKNALVALEPLIHLFQVMRSTERLKLTKKEMKNKWWSDAKESSILFLRFDFNCMLSKSCYFFCFAVAVAVVFIDV